MNLPHNIDLEKSIISHCLIVGPAEIVDSVCPDDFYNASHQKLFAHIVETHARGEPVDAPALIGTGMSAGDVARIMEYPVATDPEPACKKLKDLSTIRKTIFAASNIVTKCAGYKNNQDAASIVNDAQSSILAIEAGVQGDCWQKIGPACSETVEHLEKLSQNKGEITGVTSGYPLVDRITGGFQKSDLIILAARPGMGKTALALNIAENAAKIHTPVAFFSLEMSLHQLNCRIIARGARLNSKQLRNGRVQKDDWVRINNSVAKLYSLPLYIDDTPAQHYMEIRRRTRKLKRERGIGMVIIDYLQLARGDNPQFREREVSSISQGLKAMAKEMDIPVIALSQLNRKLDDLAEKRPSISHLRESGSLEQDSDIVVFIHRDDYYDRKDDNPRKGVAEIIFAKHRNGPTGWCPLAWIPEQSAFEIFQGEYKPK